MCQFHLQRLEVDGTDTWFRNVGILYTDAGEIPKRKYTILFVCVRKIKIMVEVKYIFGSFCLWALPMIWYSEPDTVFQKIDLFLS